MGAIKIQTETLPEIDEYDTRAPASDTGYNTADIGGLADMLRGLVG
jgi:hypothetical protein